VETEEICFADDFSDAGFTSIFANFTPCVVVVIIYKPIRQLRLNFA